MPLGEIYVKLAVGFPRDPKVRALVRYGADAGLARDLYVQMCLYCKENLTDGFVPAEEIGVLAYPLPVDQANQLAKQLASVGLTKEVSNCEANDKQGWQVCAFVKRNGTKEDVERLSEVRAKAGRAGGIKSRKRPGQGAGKAKGKQVGNQDAKQTGGKPVSVSVSVSPNGPTDTDDRDLQAPMVPVGEVADAPTETQRSKQITDAYHAAVNGMCKWPAVNGVVLSAIRSGHFSDDEIHDGLLRLAADNRSVTIDTLRTELIGFKPRVRGAAGAPRPSASDRAVAEAQAAKARFTSRHQEPS